MPLPLPFPPIHNFYPFNFSYILPHSFLTLLGKNFMHYVCVCVLRLDAYFHQNPHSVSLSYPMLGATISYIGAPISLYIGAPLSLYIGAPLSFYIGATISLYIGAPISLYIGAAHNLFKYMWILFAFPFFYLIAYLIPLPKKWYRPLVTHAHPPTPPHRIEILCGGWCEGDGGKHTMA